MTKMLWNAATGEAQVFANDENPGPDWLDHHPEDPAHASEAPAGKPAKVKQMTKAELAAALTSGGIAFDPSAKVAELDALLGEKLRAALTANGTEFAADATTSELWDQVNK
jgi:hypothetical protein